MRFLLLAACAGVVLAQGDYYLAAMGQTCYDYCYSQNLNCDPHIVTNNTATLFTQLGVQCTPDPTPWWAEDQPSYCDNKDDPNYGKCLGYVNVPGGVLCSYSYPTTRRICHCVPPASQSPVGAFGTGCSQCSISTTESTYFAQVMPTGSYGVMNHFWITAPNPVLNDAIVRYYIDGETTASIQFRPSLASGVGFNDTQAPWGTKWFGKGAADGAWFHNFLIPFQMSIKITMQHLVADHGGVYVIFRGTPNIPIRIGQFDVPANKAHMKLLRTEQLQLAAYEYVTLADIPTGNGLFFMHTLQVQSVDMNFLEGCYHAYTPYTQNFPGTLLSTGTEDFFDSAWYFNAGEFHLPVSGFTHLTQSPGLVTWSAYRFHEMDNLPFTDGFKFVWRNGDLSQGGIKCLTSDSTQGTPYLREQRPDPMFGPSTITAYAWVYVW